MTLRRWPIVALVLVAWLATGVYLVGTDEQAVVRRAGRVMTPLAEPGAHLGLPWPFDRVDRVKSREVKRVAILLPGGGESAAGAGPQFLTADRNLVNVRATVQFTIADPPAYLLLAHDVERIVAAVAESTLAARLAQTPVDRVLTLGKREIGVEAADQLQRRLDDYALGIAVRSVDVGAVEPPAEVADSFERVTSALREREQVVNQAEGFAERTLSQARGAAQQAVDQARGHRDRAIQEARGDADRFVKLLAQYEQAPSLTASRLYLETLGEVLPRLKSKLVVGTRQPLDVGIVREEKKP